MLCKKEESNMDVDDLIFGDCDPGPSER